MLQEIILKRTERNKVFDLGDGKYRAVYHCKPIHYENGKSWEDINLDFREEVDKFITDENKVSIGFRKDLKLEKYFGIRYDYEHQFEGTIKEIKLGGIEQVKSNKVSSLQRKSRTEISHQLNSDVEIINQINEVSLINFVKVSDPIEDFRIVEELHLKGLTCSNQKKGNQYIVDEYGKFNFVDEKEELKFWINPPFFKDNEGETSQNIEHTLQEINGHLIYIKTPTKEGQDDLVLAQYPILIDTNTYYSTTADGYVYDTNADWATCRGEQTGQGVTSNASSSSQAIAAEHSAKGGYQIYRSFFYFDTQSLPDAATITGAVLKLYGLTNAVSDVSAQKGTQADTLVLADFDSFSGSEYGHVTWGTGAYKSITFNATGKSEIVKDGTTKICCREYSHDYSNSAPVDTLYYNGCYFAEQANQTEDPKLEIDYTEGGGGTNSKINIGDAWKDVSEMKINIGDVWKTVAEVKINIGDVWKTIFLFLLAITSMMFTL